MHRVLPLIVKKQQQQKVPKQNNGPLWQLCIVWFGSNCSFRYTINSVMFAKLELGFAPSNLGPHAIQTTESRQEDDMFLIAVTAAKKILPKKDPCRLFTLGLFEVIVLVSFIEFVYKNDNLFYTIYNVNLCPLDLLVVIPHVYNEEQEQV